MLSKLAKFFKIMLLAIIFPIALFALYTWAALSWVYSTGERAGYVQKFSEKGYVCKTYEGELVLVSMPGTQAEKFLFTVKDKTLVEKINKSLGKRVRLTYEEHKGIPSSCFGETPYYVKNIQVLEKDAFNLLFE